MEQRAQELAEWEARLAEWEKRLAEREAGLAEREKELAEQGERLTRRAQELAGWEQMLRQKEASLAAQQQELEGLRYWLLTVAVVVGLLAAPSIVALILLWKINREASEVFKPAQPSKPITQARSSAGDDGRGWKEVIVSGNGSWRENQR